MFTNCKVSADFYKNYHRSKPHQMEINYNVQILNSDNQKIFEESLISEYYENYLGKINYTEFIKTRQDQYLDLLKQHADRYFPELLNALEKYYVPTQFGFFVNKSTDIPHLFVNSERHAQMILDIRLDIEQRLNQIVLMQATNVFEVVEKGYDLILKLTMHYWNIVCEYQANYTYCQNLRDKEIDKLKSKINKPTITEIEPYKEKEKGLNIPYKLALLDELGVIKNLNIQYTNKSDIYRILQFLTGGNIDNVKDYYNSIYGNYSGSNQITVKHREKAQELYYK